MELNRRTFVKGMAAMAMAGKMVAAWSSMYHCTRQSPDNGNAPVELPDFAQGRWKDKDWRESSLKPVLEEV